MYRSAGAGREEWFTPPMVPVDEPSLSTSSAIDIRWRVGASFKAGENGEFSFAERTPGAEGAERPKTVSTGGREVSERGHFCVAGVLGREVNKGSCGTTERRVAPIHQ